MTTLSPSMSLLALIKTGARIEDFQKYLVIYRFERSIIIDRFEFGRGYQTVGEYPLTGAGLKSAIEYWNLPF